MYRERELVQACIKHDRTAQRQLYEQYSSKFFAAVLRYVKNRADAEDVLQDAFIKIYEKIDTFKFESPLEPWLRTIVINTALKHLRTQPDWKVHTDSELIADDVAGQDFTISGFQYEELLGMVQSLPEACRAVFNLHAIEGYQHNEIAELLGIAEGTSKSQFFRGKALLQAKILGEKALLENKK
jgi:RNA polymerase sigma factor (sigma-70 family)